MPTCRNCGDEIEFRYVDERCVPIHPGGGWHCGSTSKASQTQRVETTTRRAERPWYEQDFTRPTKCPVCGADVFFIRHNGGSVWVDELGWPWPKHACFDNPASPTGQFTIWSTRASRFLNPRLGVIIRILKNDYRGENLVVEVRLDNSTRWSLAFSTARRTSSIPGSVVIFSREDKLLLLYGYREVAVHKAIELTEERNGWIQCERCSAWVKLVDFDNHDDHCRKHFKPPSPLPLKVAPEVYLPTFMEQITAKTAAKNQRINTEIDRIVRESWEASGAYQDAAEQLSVAKQEVLRRIRMLSPAIKGEVEHQFVSTGWALLVNGNPN